MQFLLDGRGPARDRTAAGPRRQRHGSHEPTGPETLQNVPGPLRVRGTLASEPLLLHRNPPEPGPALRAGGRPTVGSTVPGTVDAQAGVMSKSFENSRRTFPRYMRVYAHKVVLYRTRNPKYSNRGKPNSEPNLSKYNGNRKNKRTVCSIFSRRLVVFPPHSANTTYFSLSFDKVV